MMSRPGERMKRNEQNQLKYNAKQKDMEMKERSSRSLLANVLDIDDDFRQHSCTMSSAGSGIALSMGMPAGFPRVVSTPSGGLAPMPPMPPNQGNFILHNVGAKILFILFMFCFKFNNLLINTNMFTTQ